MVFEQSDQRRDAHRCGTEIDGAIEELPGLSSNEQCSFTFCYLCDASGFGHAYALEAVDPSSAAGKPSACLWQLT